jgi:uncharacterized protein YdhG (YjbR/CyaY superfamily)
MKTFTDIDSYIAEQAAEVRERLEQIRQVVKISAPNAEEVISYGMPAFKYHGMLVYFAAFKNHIGFYALPSGNEAFQKELSAYKQGKGSIQFPLDKRLPVSLIKKIVKFRVKENLEKVTSRASVTSTTKKEAIKKQSKK